MASACLFLAAKVEEQPRKLEHVLKILHICINRDAQAQFDTKSEVRSYCDALVPCYICFIQDCCFFKTIVPLAFYAGCPAIMAFLLFFPFPLVFPEI